MTESNAKDGGPSKSQLKRESAALQKLGEQLIDMPQARLLAIPMPDVLREAVMTARQMKSRRALYRQRQYIGRLMREIDASGVQAALAKENADQKQAARRFHHLETWRDRLVEQGDALLGQLLEEFPGADRQHVRQLVRLAQFERANDKPPAHARSLFRYLQSLSPKTPDDQTGRDW